jgi:hypothetical protein
LGTSRAATSLPAGVVDDRDRKGVFVGVYAGEHCCHLSLI